MDKGIYRRKDDHIEQVRVVGQERRPNGLVSFEYISPSSVFGVKSALSGQAFDATYEPLHPSSEQKPVPLRPVASSSKEEWRAYALYLEAQAGEKPPVWRSGPTISCITPERAAVSSTLRSVPDKDSL